MRSTAHNLSYRPLMQCGVTSNRWDIKKPETSSSANKLLIYLDSVKKCIVDRYNEHANSAEDIIQVWWSAFTKLLEEFSSSHIQILELCVMLHGVIGEFAWQLRSREWVYCMYLGIYHKADKSFLKPLWTCKKLYCSMDGGPVTLLDFSSEGPLASDPWYICVSRLVMIYQSVRGL